MKWLVIAEAEHGREFSFERSSGFSHFRYINLLLINCTTNLTRQSAIYCA
jgi:hypothetical protein